MPTVWQRIGKSFARGLGLLNERQNLVDAARRSLSTSISSIQCERCGSEAGLIRRSPDTAENNGSETWTFECIRCFHTMEQFHIGQ
jgi:hypothetical protein